MKTLLSVVAFVYMTLLIQSAAALESEFYWHDHEKWNKDDVIGNIEFFAPDGKCLIIENVSAKSRGTHDLDALNHNLFMLIEKANKKNGLRIFSLEEKEDDLAAALGEWYMELNEKMKVKISPKSKVTFMLVGGMDSTYGSGSYRVDVNGILIDDSNCGN